MTQDFARKKRKPAATRKTSGGSRKPASNGSPPSVWFFSGVFCGVFLCFLGWLAMQQPDAAPEVAAAGSNRADPPPSPDFTFYELLPEQKVEVKVNPEDVAKSRKKEDISQFLLQAGSFRQEEDAQRRRAELIILNLEPSIRQSDGDNGRWFRVFVGPFESQSKLQRARTITAQEGIETLMVKRPTAG